MDESFFPIGFFTEAFFAPQYFVEPISTPVPPIPPSGGAGEASGGGIRRRYVLKDLQENRDPSCVYNEQQDEAELLTILLSFLKTMEDNRK